MKRDFAQRMDIPDELVATILALSNLVSDSKKVEACGFDESIIEYANKIHATMYSPLKSCIQQILRRLQQAALDVIGHPNTFRYNDRDVPDNFEVPNHLLASWPMYAEDDEPYDPDQMMITPEFAKAVAGDLSYSLVEPMRNEQELYVYPDEAIPGIKSICVLIKEQLFYGEDVEIREGEQANDVGPTILTRDLCLCVKFNDGDEYIISILMQRAKYPDHFVLNVQRTLDNRGYPDAENPQTKNVHRHEEDVLALIQCLLSVQGPPYLRLYVRTFSSLAEQTRNTCTAFGVLPFHSSST